MGSYSTVLFWAGEIGHPARTDMGTSKMTLGGQLMRHIWTSRCRVRGLRQGGGDQRRAWRSHIACGKQFLIFCARNFHFKGLNRGLIPVSNGGLIRCLNRFEMNIIRPRLSPLISGSKWGVLIHCCAWATPGRPRLFTWMTSSTGRFCVWLATSC